MAQDRYDTQAWDPPAPRPDDSRTGGPTLVHGTATDLASRPGSNGSSAPGAYPPFPSPGSGPWSETQPLAEFIGVVLRAALMVLPVAALVGLAAFGLRGDDGEDATASAQVSLTSQVEWPFYDAARERALSTVQSAEFDTELRDRSQSPYIELAVDSPEDQTFVRITARAASSADAAAAANAAAELLLELDRTRLEESARAELVQAQQLLASSSERLTQREAERTLVAFRLASLREELLETVNEAEALRLREEIADLEIRRSVLNTTFNEEARRQVSLQIDVDAAELALRSLTPELELLSLARAEADTTGALGPALAAAAATVLVGMAALLLWDRLRGSVRSAWYVRQLAGLPVLADFTRTGPTEPELDRLTGSLMVAAGRHGPVVAFGDVGGDASSEVVHDVEAWLRDLGLSSMALDLHGGGTALGRDSWNGTRPSGGPDSVAGAPSIVESLGTVAECAVLAPDLRRRAESTGPVLVAGGPVTGDGFQRAAILGDNVVLVVQKGSTRVHRLQQAARSAGERGLAVLGVVLR